MLGMSWEQLVLKALLWSHLDLVTAFGQNPAGLGPEHANGVELCLKLGQNLKLRGVNTLSRLSSLQ